MAEEEEEFLDYTRLETVADLDKLFAKHNHRLNTLRLEERGIIKQLLDTRQKMREEQTYLDGLKQYVNDYLRTTIDETKQAKVIQKAHEKYLKSYHKTDYDINMKVKDLHDLIRQADKFASLPEFNPNTIRSSLMRGSLERALVNSGSIPVGIEKDEILLSLKNLIEKYAPRAESEIKQEKDAKVKQELTLHDQLASITRQALRVLRNDIPKAPVIDMNPEPKP